MERAIPVLQALTDIDPRKHYYLGHLGFALKDRTNPDWQAAKANLDRAIEILGTNDTGTWPIYEFNRALCSIKLDANFARGRPSDPALRKTISDDLRTARQGFYNYDELISQPYNLDIRNWSRLNRSVANAP